jgi:hypothetical protein
MKIYLISIFILISVIFFINFSDLDAIVYEDQIKLLNSNPIEICDDNKDNDNDGLKDYDDTLDCF